MKREALNALLSASKLQNNCDGDGPHLPGEVRLLPLNSDPHHGNVILCQRCHERELTYRRVRNLDVATPFDLPVWDSLEVYAPETNIVRNLKEHERIIP